MESLFLPYKHSALPIPGLEKVGDLINIEGPILSLFTDDISQFYLFYWVDYSESSHRWLVWKVKDENLYYYLLGQISLYDLILMEDKDYIFSVDINDDLNYENVIPFIVKLVPIDYLPEQKSYYKISVPQVAKDFIDKYQSSSNYYKILMKDKSIIFNISPTNTNFARAITTQDAGSFLSRLTRSLNGFIEENFWKTYKDVITSATEFNRLLNQVKEILAPRLFGLRFGSFEVSVGIDTVKKIDIKNFPDWQLGLLPEYEKDVVNIDYTDVQQLREIAEKYSEEAREKIYDPYIKIINSTHYDFVVKNKADKILKTYRKVEKIKEDIIVSHKKVTTDNALQNKKFVSLIVELSEGQTVEELNKKMLQSGLLFSEQVNELHLLLDLATDGDTTIYFKTPITYTLTVTNNIYTAYISDINLYLENSDKMVLNQNLQAELIKTYRTTKDNDNSDVVKDFFNRSIEKIINET